MAPHQSASVSRTSITSDDLETLSNQLLQSSLNSTSSPTLVASRRASSSSASRSRAQANPRSSADSLLLNSLQRSRTAPLSVVSSIDSRSRHGSRSRGSDAANTSMSRALSSTQQLSRARANYRDAVSNASNLKRQLRAEVDDANARVHRSSTSGLFKKMCSTDLLFLIDTTFSMTPYIDTVRNQVKDIVADVKRTFLGEADVRIAVVSYKDHGFAPHIQLQSVDFTEDTDKIHRFVDSLVAGGEYPRRLDTPENALGGLDRALQQSWAHQTRCLIHIGDAPPHGRTLNDFPADEDEFHHDGSEPHGLVHEPLLRKAIQLNINYAVLRITGGRQGTDRMALAFARIYGARNASLLPSNIYFNELGPAVPRQSPFDAGTRIVTAPQFEELALGATYSELRHLVCKTVTSSFSRTAGRVTLARRTQGQAGPNMATINEYESVSTQSSQSLPPSIFLEKVTPQWNAHGWFSDVLDTEGFCPAGTHEASTLNEMMDSDSNIPLSTAVFTVRARPKPFAHGAMRAASYACTVASNSPFVLKTYLKPGQWRPQMVEDMKIQSLAKAFALEFNGLLDIEPPLDFVVTSCLQSKSSHAPRTPASCVSLEPYIAGKYVKYNNNHTWVNEDFNDEFNQLVQAFSHFTFERSYGHLLVNDLQGDAVSRTLTDPAVQTLDAERFKLSDANLGEASIKLFFVVHKCTRYCKELGLVSSKEMFAPGATKQFRDSWPVPKPTVFCSNKLCRKIMRLEKARKSPEYEGYQWCNACWPQLDLYKKQIVCEAAGSDHKFEASEFFHQSQGEPTPDECERHRPRNAASSSAAAVGGSMFSRMRSQKSRESLAGSISGKMW
ncbi:hypothetical protein CKM354_000872900 [Cercospora kikuchii]|uniref:Alpha-type protein kinase domain-containing protein n=1 Tax=Cercospora kikuchii TaxID=84275 RepID=A0A9P3FJL0_9PEZI|nr:uncharacterized protein CKM354_000872900 [Cercospora kikuchii]GIZ45569.1 hypothetical protein CKM354_000872900 [Cercospora kikuchii]